MLLGNCRALGILLLVVPSVIHAAPRFASLPMQFIPPDCEVAAFDDVPADHPACEWIRQMDVDQIMRSCDGDNFCPDAPVTRQQLAKILGRAVHGTSDWDPWRAIYTRTILVNQVLSGDPPEADALASGARLLELVATISPGVGELWRLQLEPGLYDLDGETLVLPPSTIMSGADLGVVIESTDPALGATLKCSGLCIVRDVVIHAVGVAQEAVAVRIDHLSGHYFNDVQLRAFGSSVGARTMVHDFGLLELRRSLVSASADSGADAIGVHFQPTLQGPILIEATDIGVSASGAGSSATGVLVDGVTVELRDSRIRANGAADANTALDVRGGGSLHVHGGELAAGNDLLDPSPNVTNATGAIVWNSALTVENATLVGEATVQGRGLSCLVTAGSHTLEATHARLEGTHDGAVSDASCTVHLEHSQVRGGVTANGGTVLCAATTDGAGGFLATGCPP